MKDFLKYTLASIVGIILTFLMFFFLLLIIIAVSSQEKPVEIKSNTILFSKLNENIVERAVDNPFYYLPTGPISTVKEIGLNDILSNIRNAKKDDNISGIYLELSTINAGIGTVEEIRNALIDFKESGKFIISYADLYTQKAYYLASVSDSIYLNPSGDLGFDGLGAQVIFFKDALDKLGIEAQIIRHGTYKSAVEPFMYNEMSPENREQTLAWLESIWEHMLQGISEQRNIPVSVLDELAENLTIRSAQHALDYNLIDGLKYKDEIESYLKKLTGIKEKDDLRTITLRKYTKVPRIREFKGFTSDKIAVIYAYGDILLGNTGEGTISSERISKAIRKARRDSTIKAIVFRVNSGGGGALPSEVIWREIDLAKNVKPVVASLGDVAASGGYYIVAPADTIVANPNTITGSIGVYAVLPNAQKFFNKKLGINVDIAKTNSYSDIGSIFRPMANEEVEVIRYGVEKVYDDFVTHVSDGRGMSWGDVDKIGQGRVWSGKNAMDIGLIDLYGGKYEAIKIAAQMAGLEKYRVVELPELEDPLQQFLRELTENTRLRLVKNELGTYYRYLEQILKVEELSGIQARLPFVFEIR